LTTHLWRVGCAVHVDGSRQGRGQAYMSPTAVRGTTENRATTNGATRDEATMRDEAVRQSTQGTPKAPPGRGQPCQGERKGWPARPTLPQGYPCSTIGALKLNFRVRNGIGWVLRAIITDRSVSALAESLRDTHMTGVSTESPDAPWSNRLRIGTGSTLCRNRIEQLFSTRERVVWKKPNGQLVRVS
jgi:hypothetical protein